MIGEIPQSVQGLIDVSLLRNTAAAKGIYEIGQKGNSVILYVNDIDTNTVLNLSSMMAEFHRIGREAHP